MKKVLSLLIFSAFISSAGAEVVTAPVEHLYLPEGFDSNDTVEVVVTGSFPNACYSRNDVKVKIIDDEIRINISALSHEKSFSAKRCPDMIVPFKEVVHVGNLQGGEYKVIVNGNSTSVLMDKIKIAEASSRSVDENLYAAIEWVERKGPKEFVLHGWRYSNCIDFEKAVVISNNKDTLSILPIMKQLTDFCPMKMMPTAYTVQLDFSSLKMDRPLLHVRTMDGKSINTVINLVD